MFGTSGNVYTSSGKPVAQAAAVGDIWHITKGTTACRAGNRPRGGTEEEHQWHSGRVQGELVAYLR